jgi:pimeloyl-ACP methyl ester carboxylesterase
MIRSFILTGALVALAGCARTPVAQPREIDMLKMQLDVAGEGPPLVLVGGGLTGMQSFEPHRARLAGERRVIRAQLLSVQYGLENRPLPPGYSLRMESEALANALAELKLEGPVDLVAWSYGAATTLDYALNHPERIRTLTLIEPPAFWALEATGRLDEQSAREKEALSALNAGMKEDVNEDQLVSFMRQAAIVPPGAAPQSMPQWPGWFKHRRSLRGNDGPLLHTDSAARLKALRAPVLLVKGTGSSHFLHAIIDALAATLPDARVIELPGGHAPQIVAMDRFLAQTAEFQRTAGAQAHP